MKIIKIGSQDRRLFTNSAFGAIASVVSLLSTYATRVIFSHSFGEELYGVNSIFASIVSALLIIELGVSSAMVIFMYKPIADHDEERINTILLLYRKLYSYICLSIFSLGIIIDLFLLDRFITTEIDIKQIKLFFLLYLASIIAKYLWSYKRCILFASNQNKISSIFSSITDLVFMCVEVFTIIVLKSYVGYLIVFIAHNMGANCLCNLYVNKHYAFVKNKDKIPPTKEDQRQVFKIVKPMFVQRISNQVQDSSTSIIYSSLGNSITNVGFFSNYLLVIHAIETLYNQIALAITSSFGCSFVTDNDKEKLYQTYLKNRRYMSVAITVFVGLYCCLINPFIFLFFGKSYVLDPIIVYLTTIYLFMLLNNEINKSIQNALGEHRIDTKYMVIQTVFGIVLSIICGKLIGLRGVLLGTMISFFVFSSINKGRLVFLRVFMVSPKKYYLVAAKELISALVIIIPAYIVSTKVNMNSILSFLLFAICFTIYLSVLSIGYMFLDARICS